MKQDNIVKDLNYYLNLPWEFEFEKACRGPLIPVPNEYAWGSTNIFPTTYTVQNFGMVNELLLPDSANCNYNIDNTQFHKPSRVGVFAKSSSNRERSGSSYYGIMDLSGNLEEACINVRQRYPYYPYNDYQILFSGLTGDGSLSQEGNADVQDWPTDPYYLAISYKGGNLQIK